MAKYVYKCSECGHISDTKFVVCEKCKDGFGEKIDSKQVDTSVYNIPKQAYSYSESDYTSIKSDIIGDENKSIKRYNTSYDELNVLFGGKDDNVGIFPNSLILIGGKPGIGKSTLLLKVINDISEKYKKKCVYISAEENKSQVQERYKRLCLNGDFDVENLNNIEVIMDKYAQYDVFVIDSLNTVGFDGAGVIGGVSQLTRVTLALMEFAKTKNKTIILVGQITKDGDIAGPKIVEHMVDTVLFFDDYDQMQYRFLRSYKNRFGLVDEIAIFEMTEKGLKGVDNPSLLFVNNSEKKIGSTISLVFEGQNPMFIEINGLAVDTQAEKTITQAIGYDLKRIYQITAILQKYLKISVYQKNVFLTILGGLKINKSHIDLAILMAIVSSVKNISLNDKIFIGEIGLTGDIIKSPDEERLIKAAKKYGFNDIICYSTGYKHIQDILNKLGF